MRKKILIVDDDLVMREEIADSLEGEEFAISTAADGVEAVRMMKKDRYALVLLDLKMPRLNGFDVLRHIKNSHAGTKIIVISGMPLGSPLLGAELTPGANDYRNLFDVVDDVIGKPFDSGKLLEKIKAALA